jgi:hypothetical protein
VRRRDRQLLPPAGPHPTPPGGGSSSPYSRTRHGYIIPLARSGQHAGATQIGVIRVCNIEHAGGRFIAGTATRSTRLLEWSSTTTLGPAQNDQPGPASVITRASRRRRHASCSVRPAGAPAGSCSASVSSSLGARRAQYPNGRRGTATNRPRGGRDGTVQVWDLYARRRRVTVTLGSVVTDIAFAAPSAMVIGAHTGVAFIEFAGMGSVR